MSLNLNDWPTYFDHTGKLVDEYKLRKTSFFNGVSSDLRSNVWPFLLGLWPCNSSTTQRHQLSERLRLDYEKIRNGWINAVPELMDNEMKQSIKVIDKDVRRTDRDHQMFEHDGSDGMRKLRRILITLSVYDAELAYVQGMNELISPFLILLQEEHLVFWCFAKLLPPLRERLLTLDLSPQLTAMAALTQYIDPELHQHIEVLTEGHWIFSFRWFLLLFKNEFSLSDIFELWDLLFAQHITTHMEIFVACSILLIYKEQVIACSTSDQLLYLAQSLTSKMKVSQLIQRARDIAVQISNSKGLSEQLTALLIQTGKVPPPLVGFVRRRQCFTNVYSGRQHMNDDMIKRLMGGSRVAQTKPLFFKCMESPIQLPRDSFLQGISGALPVTVSVEEDAPPPPTDGYVPYSVSPLKAKRPDALHNESIRARELTGSLPPGYQQQQLQLHQYQQLEQHMQLERHMQLENYQQLEQHMHHEGWQYHDNYYRTQQYHYFQAYQQQPPPTTVYQSPPVPNNSYYNQLQNGQIQQHQPSNKQQHYPEYNEDYQHQNYYPPQDQSPLGVNSALVEPSGVNTALVEPSEVNTALEPSGVNTALVEPLGVNTALEPSGVIPGEVPPKVKTEGLVAQQEALSSIDDDFWGLSISVQSDAALS